MRVLTGFWFASLVVASAVPVGAKVPEYVQVGSSDRAIGSIKSCITDAASDEFLVTSDLSPYFGTALMLSKKHQNDNVEDVKFLIENVGGVSKVFRSKSTASENVIASSTLLVKACLNALSVGTNKGS